MRLYTVDRGRRLREGYVCELTEHSDISPPEISDLANELCPGGVSFHGELYLLRSDQSTVVTDANTEIIFEWVRRAKYPHRPSRFQSLFAVADLESAMDFMRQTNAGVSPIFEIDPDYAFSADMRLLNPHQTSIVKSHFADLYWRGKPFPEGAPFWEWLVPCPVVVGRQVR